MSSSRINVSIWKKPVVPIAIPCKHNGKKTAVRKSSFAQPVSLLELRVLLLLSSVVPPDEFHVLTTPAHLFDLNVFDHQKYMSSVHPRFG